MSRDNTGDPHDLNRSFDLFQSLFGRKPRRRRTKSLRAEPLEMRLLLTATAAPDICVSISDSEISEASVAETASVSVSLSVQPTADVVIEVSLSDIDVSVSTSTLTFTPENWGQEQTIIVTAIDDAELEGTESIGVSMNVVSELSALEYSTVSSADVIVNVLDYENDITIVGTEADDRFAFSHLDGSYEIEFNDELFEFFADDPQILFDGDGGSNETEIQGGPDYDKVSVSPGSIINYGTGYRVTAVRSSQIEVFSNGGDDVAYMAGSAGDDVFYAEPESAQLSGNSFVNIMNGFRKIWAKSSPGFDTAELHDSPAHDTYRARPELAYLAGDDFFNLALDFEETLAISSAGGDDVAAFHDSSGTDSLTISPNETTMSGPGFLNRVVAFRGVSAYSRHGGTDTAVINDSAHDDRFVSKTDFAYITNDHGFYGYVEGFADVEANATAGQDEAQFYDAGANDWFVDQSGYAIHFEYSNFVRIANNFTSVRDFVDQSDVTPYDDVPVYDTQLRDLDLANRIGVPFPNDWRFDFVHALETLPNSTETQELGSSIVPLLPDYYASHPDAPLYEASEYHDLIVPEGSLQLVTVDVNGIETMTLTDRFGLESRVLRLQPVAPAKGRVILMHGSYSLPEYLTGQMTLNGPEYHRTPAIVWRDAGYEVFVPEMQGTSYIDLDVLGYGFVGVETARIIDLIETLPVDASPLIVAGLSRGAAIAESVGAIDDRVDVIVSAGGSMRRPVGSDLAIGYPQFLQELSDKLLVVSAATRDTHTGWTFHDLQDYADTLSSHFATDLGDIGFHYFNGYHEMDALGEISAVENLLSFSQPDA